jgi:hypothetical protein
MDNATISNETVTTSKKSYNYRVASKPSKGAVMHQPNEHFANHSIQKCQSNVAGISPLECRNDLGISPTANHQLLYQPVRGEKRAVFFCVPQHLLDFAIPTMHIATTPNPPSKGVSLTWHLPPHNPVCNGACTTVGSMHPTSFVALELNSW